MKAQDPKTNEWFYFVDKCLPFGSSISCALFQRFSNALKHLTEFCLGINDQITNYLDDFLFLALTAWRCNYQIQQFLLLCEEVSIPVSHEKTEWASMLMVFLGIMLDGEGFTLGIPLDKRIKAVNLLILMMNKQSVTVKQLQALCGFLNFLGKAIFPGRTFTRRIYAKYSQCGDSILKQHHHIRLDQEFKADCAVWLKFLRDTDLSKVVNRPMVDILGETVVSSQDISFFSDASAAKTLGFRCILQDSWIQGFWPDNFVETCKPTIEYLELFALTAGILTWRDKEILNNTRVSIHCDNMAVVHMINGITSSCHHCMYLLRLLTLNGLKHNCRLTAKYVSTKDNVLADTLSRGQRVHFRKLGPHMQDLPNQICMEIWPITNVWGKVYVSDYEF